MAKRNWTYEGDVSIRQGGFYWKEDGAADYVQAVKVTPCSDAGGPDNLFHIESGTIFIGEDEKRIESALDTIGMSRADAARRDIVYAMNAYCGLETDSETVVRIGREQECSLSGWNPSPDVILRSHAGLRRYVEREFL